MISLFVTRFYARDSLKYWLIIPLLLGFLFLPGTLKAQSGLTLTIAGTSEPDSSDAPDGSTGNARTVLIGEVVTFRLNLEIGEGLNNSVSVVADLPAGLQYVPGSTTLSFTNDTGWSATASVIGGSSSGGDVTFDLGTINNTDSDANVESIQLEFGAIVNNIAANQSGITLTTNATLNANGSSVGTSESRIVQVIEPALTLSTSMNLTYEGAGLITTGSNNIADAGDEFTYRVSIQNTGTAPAYDIQLSDLIPYAYLEQFGTVVTTGGGSPCCFTYTAATGAWSFGWGQIDPNQTVTADLRVRVRNTIEPRDSWTNTANIVYVSLPDDNGSADTVPGLPGADNGARNGADGVGGAVDDYARTATSAAITAAELTMDKQVEHPLYTPIATTLFPTGYTDSTDDPNTGTSQHDPDPSGSQTPEPDVDLTIGEEFSYILTFTFPEGTTEGFQLIDVTLPNAGYLTGGRESRNIQLLGAEVVHVGDNLSGNGLRSEGYSWTAFDLNSDGDGDYLSLNGSGENVLNTPDNVSDDNDRYVIRIFARLDDEDASGGTADALSGVDNVDGGYAGNRIQLRWIDNIGSRYLNVIEDIDIVEPDVALSSATIAGTNPGSGDTTTFELTIANNGTAPAYNLAITDTLPIDTPNFSTTFAGLDAANSTCDNISGFAFDSSSPPQVNFSFDQLNAAASCTLRFTVTADTVNVFGVTYTNSAAITSYDSRDNASDLDNRNYHGNTTTSPVTTIYLTAAKSIAATSESHTSGQNVAIGEVVTFELSTTLPEGSLSGLVLTDTLPSGLTFITDSVSLYTSNTASSTFANISGLVPGTAPGLSLPADTDGAPTAAGTYRYDSASGLLEVKLGNVSNNDNDANTEAAVLRFQAVVANNSANNAGSSWANSYSASLTGGAIVTATTPSLIVQEPHVTLSKAINQGLSVPTGNGPFAGGDTVVYDIVVSNPTGTNAITAFDLNITDIIDSDLNLDTVTVLGLPLSSTATDNSDYSSPGQSVNVVVDQLQPSESFIVRVSTTVQNSVNLGQTITNTADLNWTSLPGSQGTGSVTPGGSGSATGERSGSGGVNDYSTSDSSDSFSISGTVNTIKTIVGTSESQTDDSSLPNDGDLSGAANVPVTVGEVMTYRLATQLPQLTVPNLVITDTLAANIEFVSASGRVSYIADHPAGGSGNFGDNQIQPSTIITPTFNSGSRTLTFVVGEFVNNDHDAGVESLIIEFDAVVVNTSDNTLGSSWANRFSADLDGDGVTEDSSNAVYALVQEPSVTISKAIAGTPPDDALEQVTYTVTLTAGNALNQSTAYDLRILDSLYSDLSLDSVTLQSAPAYAAIATDMSVYAPAGAVDVTINQLRPGDSLTLHVTATVLTSVSPGETITNTARVTWTSTPGANGTSNNTPGSAGTTTGERDGSDGVGGSLNNYAASSNTPSFSIASPVPVKSIVSTSVSQTSDTTADDSADPRPVAVGEIIRYQLLTSLPESTSISFQLNDVLSAGIEYIPGSARVSYLADTMPSLNGDFAGIQNEAVPTLTFPASRINFDSGSRELSFNFGSVINNDGDAGLERIVVEYNVLVTNIGTNSIGATAGDDFNVIIDEGLPTEIITTSNQVFYVVQEPALTLTKTASPTALNPGEVVTYTISITASNGINRSTAFDVVISDVLPNGVSYVAGSAQQVSGVAPSTITATGVPTVTFGYAALQPGENSVVQVQALVDFTNTPGALITNQADVTWTSLPGSHGTLSNPTGNTTPGNSGDADGERNGSGSAENDYNGSDSDSVTTLHPNLLLDTFHLGDMSHNVTSTLTISITNQGPGYATMPITVSDTVPTELILISAVGSGWTCSIVGQDAVCTYLLPVAPGAALPDITLAVTPTVIGSSFINTAVVTTSGELDPTDNTDDDSVTVVGTAPVLHVVPDQTIIATETLTFTLSATDINGDLLTFGLQNAPTGVTVDTHSGLVSWTPSLLQGPASYLVTAVVTDTTGLTDSQTFVITVLGQAIKHSVTVHPAILSEEQAASQAFMFTISRTGFTGSASQVDYTLSGSAGFGSDYTAPSSSGTVIFAATELTKTLIISVTQDHEVELNEDIILTLSNATAAPGIDLIYGSQSATATIVDDDSPFIYLPLIVKDLPSQPDLIITSLQVNGGGIQVTVQNSGSAAVTDAFWVDVYFNPSQTPGLNQPWSAIAPAGAVWGVTRSLAPGESLTLTVGDAYYFADESSATFPAHAQVYGYIDSINSATTYGNVSESSEANNLFGPVLSTAVASGNVVTGSARSSVGLPGR